LNNRQRLIMKFTVVLLVAIWITIALSKPHALLFVTIVLAAGFGIRFLAREHLKHAAAVAPAVQPAAAIPANSGSDPEPFIGQFMLVAARGWTPALQFALDESRLRQAHLLVLYIREVAVTIDMGGKWEDDPAARVLFTRLDAEAHGVKVHKLYSVSDSPADTIIEIAATFGVDAVVLGGSRRATLVNLLKGNVVTRVAANLPESMHLIVIG